MLVTTLVRAERSMKVPSRSKAVIAGFAGGLAGAWAMDQFTRAWNAIVPDSKRPKPGPPLPYSQQEWDSTSRTASQAAEFLLQRKLTDRETMVGAQVVHFAVGGLVMAGYAGLFPRKLKQPVASGLIFGLGLWFVAEELAMAVLKITDPPQDYSVPMHLNSLGEHFAYGVASTLVARALIAIH
jgi:hypothetical protein